MAFYCNSYYNSYEKWCCIIRGLLLGLLFWLILGSSAVSCAGQKTQPDFTVPPGVAVETNVVYGKGGPEKLLLDLAHPKEGNGPFPGIVFVHGGGWAAGSRTAYASQALAMAQQGYVCITIDYRLAPTYHFPAQIEDVKCAVRWLRANAARYHLDPKHIGAVGGSAGAHLVALLGTTSAEHKWEGEGGNPTQSSSIQAMVCHGTPADFLLGYKDSVKQEPEIGASVRNMLIALMGTTPEQSPALYRDASPVNHVSKNTPPVLLLHGSADPLVLPEQAQVFERKLKADGVAVQLVTILDANHTSFGKDPQSVLTTLTTFLKRNLTTAR